MNCKKIYLSDNQGLPYLEHYSETSNGKRPAVLIFPGGAYVARAPHEGEPIALGFLKAGFNVFVCQYRVSPDRYPIPFSDALSAIKYIKDNADALSIFKNKIAVCGFSAGGHLAGSLGFFKGDEKNNLSAEIYNEYRPDAMILCYPVISFGAFCHKGSVFNLIGKEPSEQEKEMFSWQDNVQKSSPPTFLWHTADDNGVPVQNSIMLADSLSKNAVRFELHIFSNGRHGLGLASDDLRISQWFNLAVSWLNTIFKDK